METQTERKLTRPKTDRIIAGVSSGLARYFGIDPIIIRALFVLLTISDGAGVLIYVIFWIVVPEEGDASVRGAGERVQDFVDEVGQSAKSIVKGEQKPSLDQWRNALGLFIIFIGLITLARQFFPYSWLNWNLAWACLIIIAGLYLITKKKKE